MKKKKIYISLPITGYELSERHARANYVKQRIQNLGHEVVTPFDLEVDKPEDWDTMSEKEKYAWFMSIDIYALLLCDAVYFDNEWKNSKGCRCENSTARIYGIEQIYLLSDISQVQ